MANRPRKPKRKRIFLSRKARRRRRLGRLAGIVLLLAGLGVFAQGAYIPAKAVVAQLLLERAWALSEQTGEPAKPWPWADTHPYAKVEIPRLNKSAIVLAGTSGEAMAFGPGHQYGTPAPGERGTSIIGGHRDTHFAFLKHVKAGDLVTVSRAGAAPVSFRVTHMDIRHWNESGIDPYAKGHKIALVTCYPFGSLGTTTLRYVVHAEKIDDRQANLKD
ncbi:MAG: class GN sortase [Pseudomonadota bacterium]